MEASLVKASVNVGLGVAAVIDGVTASVSSIDVDRRCRASLFTSTHEMLFR